MAVITFEIERVTTNKLQLNPEWIDVKISMFFFEIYCFSPLHDFPSTALNEKKMYMKLLVKSLSNIIFSLMIIIRMEKKYVHIWNKHKILAFYGDLQTITGF